VLLPDFFEYFRRLRMVLKNVFIAIACTALLAWSGLCAADEYRPDQFLGLDLSRAVLSPKPLGPPAEFAPVPIEAGADSGNERAPAEQVTRPKVRVAHLRSEKPHAATHTRLARHHGNPLDARALDTRIQVWPCKSGGICKWQR
jgi:hypothetical protein